MNTHRNSLVALAAMAVGAVSVTSLNLFGGEPEKSANQTDAQVGSLYPFLKATAGRSTLER